MTLVTTTHCALHNTKNHLSIDDIMGVLLCNRMQQMVNKMTIYHTHRSQLVFVENFWVAKFLRAGMVRESTLAKGLVERDLQTFQPNPGLLQWVGLKAFVDGSGSG